MKNNTHNLNDQFDKRHYKKRYIIRKYEEQEAEEEIKEFKAEDTPEQEELPKTTRES